MREYTVHLAAFALLCFIWSSSWIGIKFSLEGFPALIGAGMRFLVALALLGLYLWRSGRSFHLPARMHGLVVLSGCVTYILDYGLIYWAEQYLAAGLTAVLFATFPLFTALLSVFFFRLELFRATLILGFSVGFLGVATIFGNDLSTIRIEGPLILAGGAVLLSAMGAAFSTTLVKRYLTGIDPALLTFYQTAVGIPGLFAAGFLAGERLDPDKVTLLSLMAVLYLGAVASALAFTLYYWLLQRFHPTTLSAIVYITPVIALMIDWGAYGDAPSATVAAGIALISLGILLAELPKYRQLRRSLVREDEQNREMERAKSSSSVSS